LAKSRVDIRPNPRLKQILEQVTHDDVLMFGNLAIEASREQGVTPRATGNLARNHIMVSDRPRSLLLKSRTGYGAYVHFGTKRMVARPFFAWACEMARVQFERILNARKDYKL
jgi:hypothetical protein